MKVEVTIRCAKCDAVETVVTESWSRLATSCGCMGPYRVLERRPLAEEEEPLKPNDKASDEPSEQEAQKDTAS